MRLGPVATARTGTVTPGIIVRATGCCKQLPDPYNHIDHIFTKEKTMSRKLVSIRPKKYPHTTPGIVFINDTRTIEEIQEAYAYADAYATSVEDYNRRMNDMLNLEWQGDKNLVGRGDVVHHGHRLCTIIGPSPRDGWVVQFFYHDNLTINSCDFGHSSFTTQDGKRITGLRA